MISKHSPARLSAERALSFHTMLIFTLAPVFFPSPGISFHQISVHPTALHLWEHSSTPTFSLRPSQTIPCPKYLFILPNFHYAYTQSPRSWMYDVHRLILFLNKIVDSLTAGFKSSSVFPTEHRLVLVN